MRPLNAICLAVTLVLATTAAGIVCAQQPPTVMSPPPRDVAAGCNGIAVAAARDRTRGGRHSEDNERKTRRGQDNQLYRCQYL